ncbi:DUF397 domain-containing protein [Goodfellowiella coeruleoviolacea]|uniref:DUF397 domain-containing protein n=1 Tax=Goodfellowiella coeruleoviolacea TaxID=334858 RepID=A0AAE3KE71_9PSEU|nr:DUF397 domain-containing protein [Goodfellowiella coeruleoviolacea]MCP2164991.1 protein of unknown function (DUF397) [Goodfellowiella coeruleoviolacea]
MTTDLDGTRWRRSSYSGSQAGNCVEVVVVGGRVGVRDSKRPGVALWFGTGEWQGFLGSFTRPGAGSLPSAGAGAA